jgi:hypothetical protein
VRVENVRSVMKHVRKRGMVSSIEGKEGEWVSGSEVWCWIEEASIIIKNENWSGNLMKSTIMIYFLSGSAQLWCCVQQTTALLWTVPLLCFHVHIFFFSLLCAMIYKCNHWTSKYMVVVVVDYKHNIELKWSIISF